MALTAHRVFTGSICRDAVSPTLLPCFVREAIFLQLWTVAQTRRLSGSKGVRGLARLLWNADAQTAAAWLHEMEVHLSGAW